MRAKLRKLFHNPAIYLLKVTEKVRPNHEGARPRAERTRASQLAATDAATQFADNSNNDITSKYIGSYPLPKMQEYNSYLLKIPQTVNSTEDLLNILNAMSEEERAALMEEASK